MSISEENLSLLKAMIEKAEANLHAAKQLLNDNSNNKKSSKSTSAKKTNEINFEPDLSSRDNNSEDNIVEGVFDGQNMIGSDKKQYPIPANYASKSKLVAGDQLKLTIKPDGSYLYKQIGPAERTHVIGPLTYEDNQYKVLANGRTYKVLLASVTYYKAELGDKVALIIPTDNHNSEWGAIDHVLPKDVDLNEAGDEDLF